MMRAIAFLLLGLLALTAARPACATAAMRGSLAMVDMAEKAHEPCPEARDRTAHHACAMTTCVGCALGFARVVLPAAAIARAPLAPAAIPAVALSGLSPIVALPPPRPIA